MHTKLEWQFRIFIARHIVDEETLIDSSGYQVEWIDFDIVLP